MSAPPLSPAPPAARNAAAPPARYYRCVLPASCLPLAAWLDRESVWPGTINKLSTGGLVLLLKRRFEAGAGLAVELPASAARAEETLLVKVTRVEAVSGGEWLLRCTFLSELSEDTVQALVHAGGGKPVAAEPSPEEHSAAEGKGGKRARVLLEQLSARYRALPPRVQLGLQAAGLIVGIAVPFSMLMLLVRRAAGW
jgi:hypothetical protein